MSKGRFDFSAMGFEELVKRLDALEAANEELRKENRKLRESLPDKRLLLKDMVNGNKAIDLFSVDITNDGQLYKTTDMDTAKKNFVTFYQNVFRALNPEVRPSKTGKNGYALTYKGFTDISDEDYKVYIDTIDACVDIIYYAKQKIEKNNTPKG